MVIVGNRVFVRKFRRDPRARRARNPLEFAMDLAMSRFLADLGRGVIVWTYSVYTILEGATGVGDGGVDGRCAIPL